MDCVKCVQIVLLFIIIIIAHWPSLTIIFHLPLSFVNCNVQMCNASMRRCVGHPTQPSTNKQLKARIETLANCIKFLTSFSYNPRYICVLQWFDSFVFIYLWQDSRNTQNTRQLKTVSALRTVSKEPNTNTLYLDLKELQYTKAFASGFKRTVQLGDIFLLAENISKYSYNKGKKICYQRTSSFVSNRLAIIFFYEKRNFV